MRILYDFNEYCVYLCGVSVGFLDGEMMGVGLLRIKLTWVGCVGLLCLGCDVSVESAAVRWDFSSKGLYSAVLSASGQYAIAGDVNTNSGQLYDMQTGKALQNWHHANVGDEGIVAADFSLNEQFAVTADINTLVKWDMQTGAALGYWTFPVKIRALALSATGKRVLIGFKDASALYFDLKTSRPIFLMAHTEMVNAVDLSDDGRYAITGSDDQVAKVWDLKHQGKLLHAWTHRSAIFSVALSPKGRYAMSGPAHFKTNIWEVKTGKRVSQPGPGRSTVLSARFSADEKKILLGLGSNRMILSEVKTGDRINGWQMPRRSTGYPSGASVLSVGFAGKSAVSAIATNGYALSWKY